MKLPEDYRSLRVAYLALNEDYKRMREAYGRLAKMHSELMEEYAGMQGLLEYELAMNELLTKELEGNEK